MKTSLISFFLIIFLSGFSIIAQQSGNEAYNQSYNYSSYNKSSEFERLYLTDSTFIIKASVLYNVTADNYVAVFGLSEESTNLEECNNKIEKRIAGFIARLRKIGIAKEDVYTDMTTQNKIYDYKMAGNVAEEYLQGFEIKKNVIVRFRKIKDLDEMTIAATDFQIYDLVKVDYLVDDINKIYVTLFQTAMEVINQKKTLFLSATNASLHPVSQIYGEQFYNYTPNQLYKSYAAYESGDISAPYKSYTVKKIRKNRTFYYNIMDYSGFDKIINSSVTEPAIEYVFELAVKFQINKSK